MRWPSHKDHARKALAKLAGQHLPVTLKQVEKAVAKAHAEQQKTTSGHTTTSRGAGGVDETSVAELGDPDAPDVDERHEENLGDQVPDLEAGEVPM